MIGEIRDLETAEMAVQAALTGHLVLSTLHTNDAPSAITRLMELGIPPYLIRATVLGVMAQRLARMLCPHCKQPGSRMLTLADADPAVGRHCCPGSSTSRSVAWNAGTRLHGPSRGIRDYGTVRQLTARSPITASWNSFGWMPKEGMKSLRLNGAQKVAAGLTTVEEILR